MYTNLEIEFKTFLTKEKYEEILACLDLENIVFPQTNYYFDSSDLSLEQEKTVLRIRQKPTGYKLTSKVTTPSGNLETHLMISDTEALDMIQNGFNASVIGINKDVTNICSLTTYRASTTYKNGTLFLDKSVYNGITDYELEFESSNMEDGKKEFDSLLKEFKIEYNKSNSKFKRSLLSK